MEEPEAERFRRLPPGTHGIPRELVERNQRERLIAAMTEECAAGGYAETSVAKVTRRAGVSSASFYRQFKDRRECMLASFEELFGRLLEAVERACAGAADPAEKARAGIRTAAQLLAADPPTARLLTIEVAAVGLEGVGLQHESIERLATLLRESQLGTTAPETPFPSREWLAVAAMVALVAKRAAEGENPDHKELEAIHDSL